jgi:hypothetical protein
MMMTRRDTHTLIKFHKYIQYSHSHIRYEVAEKAFKTLQTVLISMHIIYTY